ncbi:uncharacterized protein ACNLHF_003129 [Anomaloglossus baeobatrachus]
MALGVRPWDTTHQKVGKLKLIVQPRSLKSQLFGEVHGYKRLSQLDNPNLNTHIVVMFLAHLQKDKSISTTSKIAYFKRKYAEEENLHPDYQGYFPKHVIIPEDRSCILKLSLEKLRFLEDPEIYLRRSVLINNLLRKIHLEGDKENYDCYKGSPSNRSTDVRKRVKLMVKGYSQSLHYEELCSYIVPYAAENMMYPMGYSNSHLTPNSPLLIYRMKE